MIGRKILRKRGRYKETENQTEEESSGQKFIYLHCEHSLYRPFKVGETSVQRARSFGNKKELKKMAAGGSRESGRGRPSSVRSRSEPGFDPVEQIVPVVIHLICVRAPRAVAAGGDPVNETGKDYVLLILAGRIVFIKLLSIHKEVMSAHRG